MTKKINLIRTILILLLIFLFVIIFHFSNQNGEKSGSLSRKVTENVTKNVKSIQKMEKSEKEKILDKIEHFIRKLAHFSLYMLVGILTMSLMSTYDLKQKNRIGISLLIGVLYATTDEIHQAFIPERTAAIGDIGIDSCGVIVGIWLIAILLNLMQEKITKSKF